MKIRKGDIVVVIRGDDKGKSGKVLSVDPVKKLVVVQRVRLQTRHQKPGRKQALRGGTIEKEAGIAISAVALIDPKSNKPTRIKMGGEAAGESDRKVARRLRVRLSVKSGVEIERPVVKAKA